MEKFSELIKKLILFLFAFFVMSGMVLAADANVPRLNDIEKSYYGYTYQNENTLSRLNRLEKAIYGMTYNSSADSRINRIYKDLNPGVTGGAAPVANSAQNTTSDIGPKAEAGIKYPIVDKLEQKVFKKSFPNDEIYSRLSRLEKQVYKKESTASLNERVDALRSKLLGGDRLAADDSDVSSDEIVFDKGYNYEDDNLDNSSKDSGDSQYNYYSYENSKNEVPEIQSRPVDSRSDNASTVGNYAGQSYDLDVLEKSLFGKRYTNETSSQRLARLESQVFHRTFTDGDDARVQRLLAVTTAKKTSQEYDSNKWARRINTGIQVGSILLMVLAMIL